MSLRALGPRTCRSAVARRTASAAMAFATEVAAPRSGPIHGNTDSLVTRTTFAFPVLTGVIGRVCRMRSARGATRNIRSAFLTHLSPAVARVQSTFHLSCRPGRHPLDETCTRYFSGRGGKNPGVHMAMKTKTDRMGWELLTVGSVRGRITRLVRNAFRTRLSPAVASARTRFRPSCR
jgi:hypothetical protein